MNARKEIEEHLNDIDEAYKDYLDTK